MKSISLVMIVKNEEQNIQRCFDSVKGLVSEIVVVDTGSTDRTTEIALLNGAKLFSYEWDDNFSNARNFALEKASSDWCLVLDADEYVLSWDKLEIAQFLEHKNVIGQVKIISVFKDEIGENSKKTSNISRMLPHDVRYSGRIHEQPDLKVKRQRLNIEIMHDGYYEKNKSHRNIPLLKKELEDDHTKSYIHFQLGKEYRGIKQYEQAYEHCKLSYEFSSKKENFYPNVVVDYLYSMISYQKLEDGLAIITACDSQLHDFADFHFVSGLIFLELMLNNPTQNIHLLPRIEGSYKRCLEIGEQSKYDTVFGSGSFSALHNLGVYYEVLGRIDDAKQCYQQAANLGYKPALERLRLLS